MDRIQELADQARASVTPGLPVDQWIAEYNRRFAELIVQECVAQIQPMWEQVQKSGPPPGYDYATFDLAYNDCMNAIREHFGVE